MSIFCNLTEQDLINIRKLADQQKNQRALKSKNRSLKQTHDIKLAENLSPITKRLDVINEPTKQLGEIVKKSEVQDGNTQTPAIENIAGTQSLRDTLTPMKRSRKFFNLQGKSKGDVFWNIIPLKSLAENRIRIEEEKYDINPNIQSYFTNTKSTTKNMDNGDKLTVFNIVTNVDFYSMAQNNGFKSARMRVALYNLPKAIAEIRNPTLTEIENIEDVSDDLQGEGRKIIIPSAKLISTPD